jgi:dTDP-4-amino-4,6-dideoxygalactose transaminase
MADARFSIRLSSESHHRWFSLENKMPETAVVPISRSASPKPNFPFLDLQAQYATIKDEIKKATDAVLENQHFILGAEVERLEKQVATLTQSAFAIGCASGSDALLLSLMALRIAEGDEVITTPFTFGATAGSIVRVKACPVFVDIDPETYNIDPAKIERAITRRTRAIMPVHLFGLPADMTPIVKIARKYGLAVIEDAAQAIGASYHGRAIGSLGTTGCFSFFPSKNLGGAGDGGMITTNDPEVAKLLRMMRQHGSVRKYEYEVIGANSRLDAIQAAILNVKLPHLENWAAQRKRNADRYRVLFEQAGMANRIGLPCEPAGLSHVYNQFTIRVPVRDQLRDHLRRDGIPSEIYYPYPLHTQKAFAYLGYSEGDFPVAESAARDVVSLPIYPELTDSQQASVVRSIAVFLDKKHTSTAA